MKHRTRRGRGVLAAILAVLGGKREPGECFPDQGKKVPYPNPHPTDRDGCFPAPPASPARPAPRGPRRHPHKTPTPNRRGR